MQFETCAFPNTEKAKGTELQFRPIYLVRKLLTTPRTSSFSDLNRQKTFSPHRCCMDFDTIASAGTKKVGAELQVFL